MDWIARLVGAFYILAGVITVRQAIMNWRLERVFGAFMGTSPAEKAADVMLAVIAALTLLSGLTLAFLSRWAVPAFVACWIVQAGYLLWAQRWLRPEGPELTALRRSTINAFVAYTGPTLAVLWWCQSGVLR
ncbi:hypothetical protein [Brevundimonas sp.]|uniref:hypothetical protein n=1 Tax=Brevundimonas sp. TaxID=1871086 RepID=UPI002737C8E1|nr:hypothetical protein [Brevundimonas sp.]MDP3802134.1 hypothetical protein [Brevundimonas sp.]